MVKKSVFLETFDGGNLHAPPSVSPCVLFQIKESLEGDAEDFD